MAKWSFPKILVLSIGLGVVVAVLVLFLFPTPRESTITYTNTARTGRATELEYIDWGERIAKRGAEWAFYYWKAVREYSRGEITKSEALSRIRFLADKMEDLYLEAKLKEPPPRFAEVHKYYTDALFYYQEAMKKTIDAIETLDQKTINEVEELLDKANAAMEKANELLKQLSLS